MSTYKALRKNPSAPQAPAEWLTALREYVARMRARPAYQRALAAGGPYAFANP